MHRPPSSWAASSDLLWPENWMCSRALHWWSLVSLWEPSQPPLFLVTIALLQELLWLFLTLWGLCSFVFRVRVFLQCFDTQVRWSLPGSSKWNIRDYSYLSKHKVDWFEDSLQVGFQVGFDQTDMNQPSGAAPGRFEGIIRVEFEGPKVQGEGILQEVREGLRQVYTSERSRMI